MLDSSPAYLRTLSSVIYPSDRFLLSYIRENIATKVPLFDNELRLMKKEDGYIWVYVRFSHFNGEITAAIVDISVRKEMEELLRVSEQEYKIAVEHSGTLICEYNISADRLSCHFDSENLLGMPRVVVGFRNCPETMLFSESRDDFNAFFDRLRRGDSSSSAIIRVKNKKEKAIWLKIDGTTIFNDSDQPLSAIITLKDVTDLHEKELAYEKWISSMNALDPKSYRYFEFELDTDELEREQGLLKSGFGIKVTGFEDLTRPEVLDKLYGPDRQKYADFLSEKRMRTFYSSGVRETQMEFRVCLDSALTWIRCAMQLLPDPYSSGIKACVLYEDIDEQKRELIRIEEQSKKDPLTGVLNRAAFIEQMDALIAESGQDAQHALIIIDIDNFKNVNDSFGHVFEDRILIDISANLKSLLRPGDLTGRLGGDEFVLCLKNIPYNDVIVKRAQCIIRALESSLMEGVQMSGSVGVALYPQDGGTFGELYEHADAALYHAKRAGKGTYAFYDPSMEMHIKEPFCLNNQDADGAGRHGVLTKVMQSNQKVIFKQNDDERNRIVVGHFSFMLDWNFETDSFYASKGASAYVLGMQSQRELFSGRVWADSVFEDDFFKLKDFLSLAAAGADNAEAAVRLKRMDTGFEWTRMLTISIMKKGETKRVLILAEPFNGEKEEMASMLKGLMNSIPAGVVLIEAGETFKPLYLNPYCYKLAHLSADDAERIAEDLSVFICEQDRQAVVEALKETALSGAETGCVYRNICGETICWRYIRALRMSCEQGKCPMLAAVVTDITDITPDMEGLRTNRIFCAKS